MLRKWEYIAKRCDEEGKHKAGRIARKLDTLIVELYHEEKITEEWEEVYDDLKEWDITDIVSESGFCVPCSWHSCKDCRLSKADGVCGINDGLFNKWFDAYNN